MGYCYAEGRPGIKANETEAVKWFEKAASQDNITGLTNSGVAYHFGKGVDRDYEKAFKYYKKAVDQGSAHAENYIGMLYFEGLGLEKSIEKSFYWFERAAEKGHSLGLTNLAISYLGGEGVAKNEEKAVELLKKASKLGDQFAKFNLSSLYMSGLGVEKNVNEGFRLAKELEEEGYADGLALIADCYHLGIKVKKNEKKAEEYWIKVTENLETSSDVRAHCCYSLVEYYYRTANGDKNKIQACGKYLHIAVSLGHPIAAYNIAILYQDGFGVEKNRKKSNEFLIYAAEKDYDEAQILLGTRHANGYGFEKSFEKAFYWFQTAARNGNNEAKGYLATMYQFGDGCKQDLEKASYWAKLGAEGGDANSQFVYASLLNEDNQSFDEQIVWLRKAASQGNENALATLTENNIDVTSGDFEILETQDYSEKTNVIAFPFVKKIQQEISIGVKGFFISPEIDEKLFNFYGTSRSKILANNKEKNVSDYLNSTENLSLEFKASFRTPYPEYPEKLEKNGKIIFRYKGTSNQKEYMSLTEINKDIEESSLKSIVGFLNSSGGELVIGIYEDKSLNKNTFVGIKREEEKVGHLFKDRDSYERYINQQIQNRIGMRFLGEYISFDFVENGDDCICVISCKEFIPGKDDVPAMLDESKCYRRTGPRTDELKGVHLAQFVSSRISNH